MLSAMQAMAKMTTSVAEVTARPMRSSPNGSMASTAAAMIRGKRSPSIARSLEPLNAFAEQPARPEQQDQHHQQIDGSGGKRRVAEGDDHPLDQADQQCGDDHAPERSE